MILKLAPNCRFVDHNIDTMLLQMFGRPDSREHQYLRRIECASRQDHSAPRLHQFAFTPPLNGNTGYTAVFDHQLLDQCAGTDFEIGLAAQWLNIGARRRPAFAVLLRDLIKAETFLAIVVEVCIARQLQLRRALNESRAGWIGPFLVRNGKWPIATVIFITAANIAFATFEVGQDILIGPSGTSHGGPIVIVPRIAADIDHGIDC